jgi:ribosomal protein L6P/L9E
MPSRVGKKPIDIPSGVQVTRNGVSVNVKGPKGEMSFTIAHGVDVAVEPKEILVSQVGGGKQALALHGTTRAVIANMVTGVTTGFSKTLEITARVTGRSSPGRSSRSSSATRTRSSSIPLRASRSRWKPRRS